MKVSIDLLSENLYYRDRVIANPHRATVTEGVTALVGPNGSGKSTLAEILCHGWNFRTNRINCSQTPHPSIKAIRFDDIHSLAGLKVEYYQQRYEACANDDVPSVAEALGPVIDSPRWKQIAQMMHLDNPLQKKVNWLSSGELRKVLVANAMASEEVDLLILDNPYIGLDRGARDLLDEALSQLAATTSVMLLVSDPTDIPDYVTCIIPMRDMAILKPLTGFDSPKEVEGELLINFDYAIDLRQIPDPPTIDNESLQSVVDIRNIDLSYGLRQLLHNFSWHIAPGEHWGLSGPNGSGKSTLLSLLNADNPRGYALDISLFGRRRGSGESIWDIKRRVGFISPELSLHFHPSGTVATIIAQGLNDTNGLFHPITPAQQQIADQWMSRLHLSHLADRRWNTLSRGEQQLALLARIMVKQPRLMIFDEPFHGLDYARKRAVRALINYFAARSVNKPERYPLNIIMVSHYADEMPECLTHFLTLRR